MSVKLLLPTTTGILDASATRGGSWLSTKSITTRGEPWNAAQSSPSSASCVGETERDDASHDETSETSETSEGAIEAESSSEAEGEWPPCRDRTDEAED